MNALERSINQKILKTVYQFPQKYFWTILNIEMFVDHKKYFKL